MPVPRRGVALTLATALVTLPLVALSGCGGGSTYASDELAERGGIERLELASLRTEVAEGADTARSLAHIAVPDELPTDWQIKADSVELVHESTRRRGGPWSGLALVTEQVGQVIIPGKFDPAQFNRAILRLRVKNKIDVGVRLFRKGEVVIHTTPLRIPGDKTGLSTVVIDVAETIEHEEPFDAVAFYFHRLHSDPVFVGVDLVWTPLREWLPAAAGGPAPVSLEDEFRAAVALAADDPLAAEFTPRKGSVLRFGFGRPATVRREGQRVSLEVVLESGETSERRAFPLPVQGRKAKAWTDAEIDLAAFEDLPTRARFALVDSSKGEQGETLCALSTPYVVRRARAARTVVLVTSDTHRADHIGAHSEGVGVATPFLDGLASRGVLFEDCFSSTNITNPSHASILTAVSPRDTGMVDNVTALGARAETIAEAFQAAGFRTLAAVSAGHMRHPQSGLGQGFDRMFAPSGKIDVDAEVTVETLTGWLDESEGLPLFVWLHVFDAHAPYEVPEEMQRLYYDHARDPFDPNLELPHGAEAKWDEDVRDLDYLLSQYKSEVTYLDAQLARMLTRPRFKDAIIAVTGDHGESLGNHGLYFTHQGLFPDTLAVPLILTWPDAPAGERITTPVGQLDLARTLLDLAGLGGADFPGDNLLRWVEDTEREPEPRFALSSHGMTASIELDGWFLALALRTHGSPRRVQHQVELYDLSTDPACNEDLVEREHERARELRAQLLEWLADAREQRLSQASANQDTRVLEQLAEIGYATEASAPVEGAGWYEPDPADPWVTRFE